MKARSMQCDANQVLDEASVAVGSLVTGAHGKKYRIEFNVRPFFRCRENGSLLA